MGAFVLPWRRPWSLHPLGRGHSQGSRQSGATDSPARETMPPLRRPAMERYSFTLEVVGIDLRKENYEDALLDAGCDDALIAVINDRLVIDFDREAQNFEA